MKRILAILLTLTLTVSALFTLTSCGQDDGAPDGMALVKGGESVGYYFYGPEEWVVANVGSIACTYASKIDTTSMTFVETEKPAVSIKDYFESEKTKFPYEINVSVNGESCTFGNADTLATKYVYSYTYKGTDAFYIVQYIMNDVDEDTLKDAVHEWAKATEVK